MAEQVVILAAGLLMILRGALRVRRSRGLSGPAGGGVGRVLPFVLGGLMVVVALART